MYTDYEKIEKAKVVLQKIAEGINPITGEQIEKDSFLNDGRIVRCFYFVAEVLDKVTKGTYSSHNSKSLKFIITPEQKERVRFPEGNIGVKEFSRCVNACIDPNESKKLSGVELNKRLKKLGIIIEVLIGDGKTRAAVNEKSATYGFEAEKRSYNGVEFDMVVMNDLGKKYLLDNIESIMSAEV